jgi:hypothetical protein
MTDDHIDDGPSAVDELLQIITEFVTAPNWDASREVLEAHPVLIAEEVDMAFGALIKHFEAEGDEKTLLNLITHRDLLRLCRAIGIDAAFAQATGGDSDQDPFEELVNSTIAVMTTLPARRADWREVVQQLREHTPHPPTVDLLEAVLRLIDGEAINAINPVLESTQAAYWDRIVAAIRQYENR